MRNQLREAAQDGRSDDWGGDLVENTSYKGVNQVRRTTGGMLGKYIRNRTNSARQSTRSGGQPHPGQEGQPAPGARLSDEENRASLGQKNGSRPNCTLQDRPAIKTRETCAQSCPDGDLARQRPLSADSKLEQSREMARKQAQDRWGNRSFQMGRETGRTADRSALGAGQELWDPGTTARRAQRLGKLDSRRAVGRIRTDGLAGTELGRLPRRRIKAADRPISGGIRAAGATGGNISPAIQAASQAPRRMTQAVRTSVKTVRATTGTVAKAVVSTVTKAAAGSKAVAAVAVCGGAAVLVVLMIVLVAMLLGSAFGVFFSGEDTGSGYTMPEAVTQLNGEFTSRIEQIQNSNTYDTLDIDNTGVSDMISNWTNVLAVYAVRTALDADAPSEVVTLTGESLSVLREVFWDMNEITYTVETVKHAPASENEAPTAETILHITITVRNANQMAEQYGFTEEQRETLVELMKPEYQNLFLSLTGSYQDITLSSQQVREILAQLPEDLSDERRQVVLTAYQLLGRVNYFWGGKSLTLGWDSRWGTAMEVTASGSSSTGTVRPYGLDCSGFVDWVFYNVTNGEYVIGHGGGASAQHSYCTETTWAEAEPGDLVFYSGDEHVGIVCGFDDAGEVLVIHCASGANSVVVTGKSGFVSIAKPVLYQE